MKNQEIIEKHIHCPECLSGILVELSNRPVLWIEKEGEKGYYVFVCRSCYNHFIGYYGETKLKKI